MIKKERSHGARHGKTEEQKEYHSLGMRGRDAARKLTLKVGILQVFTIADSKIKFIVEQECMQRFMIERGHPLCSVFG